MDANQAIKDYMPLIRNMAQSYYKSGLRRRFQLDDLVTEGMVAVWKCSSKYIKNDNVTFGSYAKSAIDNALNQLKTYDKTRPNVKHFVSVDVPFTDDEDTASFSYERFESNGLNPEQSLIHKRINVAKNSVINELDDTNRELIERVLKGETYKEIAESWGVSKQAVTKRANVLYPKVKSKYEIRTLDRIRCR